MVRHLEANRLKYLCRKLVSVILLLLLQCCDLVYQNDVFTHICGFIFAIFAAVGVVIGKGGEMIKKIQNETGCKLQFIQGKGDGPGDRRCIISGTKQQVEDAKRTIEDLIESVMVSFVLPFCSTSIKSTYNIN